MGAIPTRLVGAGLAAAIVLTFLGAATAAARGAPAQAPPTLVRLAAPAPVPHDLVTPVEPQPEPAKKRPNRVQPTTEVAVAAPPVETTTTTTAPPPPPKPQMPEGKGMWVWKPEVSDHGDVAYMVARAKGTGLTHLFVRTGSTWDGFQNAAFLNQLLPAAHAAGLKVYGWDFPKLSDTQVDVARAVDALRFTAPGGHNLDGFAADIETASEGTNFTAPLAAAYGQALRQAMGPSMLLIAVVPNPTPQMLAKYNYDAVVPAFDVIAPMVYWLNREPGTDVLRAMQVLSRYHKPLMPIGQAYDGAPEGGRPGVPPPAEILRFMNIASENGAVGVSFWSWQHANPPAWEAIREGPSFKKKKADQSATAGG